MYDLSKPVSYRVPLEYREAFQRELIRLKVKPNELTQKLVFQGLAGGRDHNNKSDFVVKNIAFMTQILSELLNEIAPEKKIQILQECQERALHIFDLLEV